MVGSEVFEPPAPSPKKKANADAILRKAGGLDEALEEKAINSRLDIDKLKDGNAEARERFARAEENMKAFADTARRIEVKLDRLLDDRAPSRSIGPR